MEHRFTYTAAGRICPRHCSDLYDIPTLEALCAHLEDAAPRDIVIILPRLRGKRIGDLFEALRLRVEAAPPGTLVAPVLQEGDGSVICGLTLTAYEDAPTQLRLMPRTLAYWDDASELKIDVPALPCFACTVASLRRRVSEAPDYVKQADIAAGILALGVSPEGERLWDMYSFAKMRPRDTFDKVLDFTVAEKRLADCFRAQQRDGATESMDRRLKQEEWSILASQRLVSELPPEPLFVPVPPLTQDKEYQLTQMRFERRIGLDSNDGKLHVLATGIPSGCAYQRIELPARGLAMHGERVVLFPTMVVCPELLAWADMIQVHQPGMPQSLEVAAAFKEIGKPVLIDSDDYIFGMSPTNPSYNRIDFHEVLRWLDLADAMIVANEMLLAMYGDLVQDYCLKFVLPNCLPDDLNIPVKQDYELHDPPRLLWLGGRSHYDDLELLDKLLRPLSRVHPFELHLMGYAPEDKRLFRGMNVIRHEGASVHEYRRKAAEIDADIGLCPLVDNQFNRCKSHLKYLDYGISGLPVMASAVEPYVRYTRAAMLLENDPCEWKESLLRFFRLPSKDRKSLGQATLQDAQRFLLSKQTEAREECYITTYNEVRRRRKHNG